MTCSNYKEKEHSQKLFPKTRDGNPGSRYATTFIFVTPATATTSRASSISTTTTTTTRLTVASTIATTTATTSRPSTTAIASRPTKQRKNHGGVFGVYVNLKSGTKILNVSQSYCEMNILWILNAIIS